ncbi:MAG: hypothetical protein GYA45_00680 [Pelolinea sp.]|jgi:hypothetical protein|nr:hypothetical protein [Pelolinea sp.]
MKDKKNYINKKSLFLFVTVFFLQILSVHFNKQSNYQINTLDFGGKALTTSVLSIGTGILSGIGTVFLFIPGKPGGQKENNQGGAILSLVIAGLGLILKILFSACGFLPFSALKPFFSELYEWMMYSQLPSFWAGLAIGWMLKYRKSTIF